MKERRVTISGEALELVERWQQAGEHLSTTTSRLLLRADNKDVRPDGMDWLRPEVWIELSPGVVWMLCDGEEVTVPYLGTAT
tara:strand:- start:151 stop:396 length:246 start_codon:yes stop_codon:yes gene_type:complete